MKKPQPFSLCSHFFPRSFFPGAPRGMPSLGHRSARLTSVTKKNVKLLLGEDTLGSLRVGGRCQEGRDASYGWHLSASEDVTGFSDARIASPDENIQFAD